MMKKRMIIGIAALALVIACALAVTAVALAQSGTTPTQGLPARYVPAFAGAGIDTSALLGPYCKSADTAGNTMTVVCQDDTGAEHSATLTSGAGGTGGLDRAAVDARVRAGVSAWAQDGNIAPIPLAKLVNISNTLPVTAVREAGATLNAHDIGRLGTQRVEVVPAPGPGHYIIVREVAIIKTGAAGLNADSAHLGLALADPSGGLLPEMPAQPGGESSNDRSIYQATATEVLRGGHYVRYIQPTGQMGHLAWADQGLVVYGQATDQATWDNLTGSLVGVTLEIRVRYEIRDPLSDDAMLANLLLGGTSPDEWSPRFSPGVYSYNVAVPHSTMRTFVEPMPENPGAVFAIMVNPTTALTSIGPTGAQVELDVGITTVTVMVTAQDGATRAYTVNITRADQ